MIIKKKVLRVIFCLGLLFCVFACIQIASAFAAQVIDRIVAVVNDDVITQSELQESMLPFIADYKVR